MMLDRCDGSDRAPTGPAIGGIEGAYSGLVGVIDRHNYGAIRAHNGLSPNDPGIIGRRGAPCGTTIRRGAHLEQVAGCIIVPFNVAIAVVGAARRIVTDDPLFVEATLRMNCDGIGPGRAAIGRLA